MKGKVLGVASAAEPGVITGEDGSRYRYTAADWKGTRDAVAGAQVDFDAEGNAAREIYPALSDNLLSGMSAPDLNNLAKSPIVEKLRGLLTTTLAFPLALLVIVVFFLPAISWPAASLNQFDIGKVANVARVELADSDLSQEIERIDQQITETQQEIDRQRSGVSNPLFGSMVDERYLQNQEESKRDYQTQRGEMQAASASISLLKTLNTVFIARFAALAAAVWLIWLSWSGRAAPLWSLLAGGLAIATGALTWAFESALGPAIDIGAITGAGAGGDIELVTMLASAFATEGSAGAAISVGIGTWLLFLLGAALIASGLGLIRNPLSKQ